MMPNRSLKLKQGCRWHTLYSLPYGGYNAGAHLTCHIIYIEGLKLTEEKGRRKKNS